MASARFLGYIPSMNSAKPFFKGKLYPGRVGLILLAAFGWLAATATGLLAQTNAFPGGPVNAQPPAGASSSAIIGLPATGVPGGAPSNAIIALPITGVPGGAPSSAIIGSSTNGLSGGVASNAITGSRTAGLPGGAPSSGLIGSRTNGHPVGVSSNSITGMPVIGLPGGAPSSAIIGSPASGLPGGAPSSAVIGSRATGLPGGAPPGAVVGRTSTNSPGGTPTRAATGVSSAGLKRMTNSKAAPGYPITTTTIPPRRYMPATNKPALSTNHTVSAGLAGRSPAIKKAPAAGPAQPVTSKASPRKLNTNNIPPVEVEFLPWTNTPAPSTNRAAPVN